MGIVLTVLILGVLAAAFALPLFEFAFSALLLAPLMYYVLLAFSAPSFFVAWLSVVLVAALLIVLSAARFRGFEFKTWQREIHGVAVFCAAFMALYALSLSWPDFIAMGERLRDYAIQAELIKHPLHPQEPWMSGAGLYYYIYWYRFGALLSQLFQLEPWNVYHQLVSISLALYIAATFCIFRRHLGFSFLIALLSAVFIGLGSNLDGVIAFFNKDNNWWGPSRVIPGAINEFPAWSFLLGDLHPHYLNIAAIPFLILLFLSASNPGKRVFLRLPPENFALFVGLILIPPVWLRASNAWEVPFWCGLALLYILLLVLSSKARILFVWRRVVPRLNSLLAMRSVLALAAVLLACAVLWVSSPKIPAGEGNPIRFVAGTVAASRTFDLLQHWGFPLLLVAVANVALIPQRSLSVLCAVLLGAALLFDAAAVFLYTLFGVNCLRVLSALRLDARRPGALDTTRALMEAIGLGALGLIILGEIIFLDDPYGGENERMNTIFKIYTSAWFLLHIFAFWLFAQGNRILSFFLSQPKAAWGLIAVLLISFGGFTFRTVGIRQSGPADVLPREQGLSEVERRFPGSALTIKELLRLPQGVVLEAQGNAYDYTSFVSTLSSQQSYLGWANHVNLLTKDYGEVQRREKFTSDFYSGHDCEAKRAMLKAAGITYVVFGSLERAKFPQANASDFNCLRKLFEQKDYQLYTP